MLTGPTTPVLANYFDVFPQHDGGAPAIWLIEITEYVVISLLRVFVAAHDGTVGFACIDPRMCSNGGNVLVPLPSGTRRQVDDINFFEILLGR